MVFYSPLEHESLKAYISSCRENGWPMSFKGVSGFYELASANLLVPESSLIRVDRSIYGVEKDEFYRVIGDAVSPLLRMIEPFRFETDCDVFFPWSVLGEDDLFETSLLSVKRLRA